MENSDTEMEEFDRMISETWESELNNFNNKTQS